MITKKTMQSFVMTMPALNEALSLIPFTRITVTMAVIRMAGRSSTVWVEMSLPSPGS